MSRTMNASVLLVSASLKEIRRANKTNDMETCWAEAGKGFHPAYIKKSRNGVLRIFFKRLVKFECGHVCCAKCARWEEQDRLSTGYDYRFFCFKCMEHGQDKNKVAKIFYSCDRDVDVEQ